MKKLLALLVSLLMLASCLPCVAAEAQGIVVAATTYPLFDIAKSVVGDYGEVVYFSGNDEQNTAVADLIFCVGNEQYLPKENSEVVIVRAANGIELIENDYDVLTTPLNVMICASYLADQLAVLDAANNDMYQANLGEFVMALSELDLRIQTVVANCRAVYCNDGSMAYFAREYGVELAENADGAVTLLTYNNPSDEDAQRSYIDLMINNVLALENDAAK